MTFRVGIRELGQGVMEVGMPYHFFPSPVQKEDEGVMMYLEKNRIADL